MQGFAQQHAAQLLSELPTRWEKLGDLALLPRTCMASPDWGGLGQPLWRAVVIALGVERLAMQALVANTGRCSSICLSHFWLAYHPSIPSVTCVKPQTWTRCSYSASFHVWNCGIKSLLHLTESAEQQELAWPTNCRPCPSNGTVLLRCLFSGVNLAWGNLY